jgi:hypothetical protein
MKMNKEMYILILAYTPNLEKVDGLREIIKTLKMFGYKICLATHSSTPQDIIDRCDYFIFDKKNEVNYDPDIAYWIFHQLPEFEVRYKQYGSMSTHIVPIVRLITGAFSYLKAVGIEKVCMIEYDVEVHNDEIFKIVDNDLNDYTLSSLVYDDMHNENKYLFGVWGVNLTKYDPATLPVDDQFLIDKYREYFNNNMLPASERIFYDVSWSKYPIKWNLHKIATKSLTFGLSHRTEEYGKNSYLFHVHNDTLHFFAFNQTPVSWNFDILFNNTHKVINTDPYSWVWVPVAQLSEVSTLKLFHNNKLAKTFDMSNQNDLDLVTKWVKFIPNNK